MTLTGWSRGCGYELSSDSVSFSDDKHLASSDISNAPLTYRAVVFISNGEMVVSFDRKSRLLPSAVFSIVR